MYSEYTITVKLNAPVITTFQSDTIFGHICWAIRYLWEDGEKKLKDFLKEYDTKPDDPPLLVSSGFPKGHLPKPVLPPITQAAIDCFIAVTSIKGRIENSFKIKTVKNASLIPVALLDEISKEGEITAKILFEKMFERYDSLYDVIKQKYEQSAVIQHNRINRISNTVKEGLYFQEETFHAPEMGEYNIYLKTNCFSKRELHEIFRFIGMGGYGKDSSTGKGQFTVEEIKDSITLPSFSGPNAFMTLSSFIPQKNDPIGGYYQTILKFGKLGDVYAAGSADVSHNPFKVPLLMFAPGSVFYGDNYNDKNHFYGRLISDVHSTNKEIKHYAYAFPLNIRIDSSIVNSEAGKADKDKI
ncbi:MAG: hypothetical protein HQK96_12830 [Nitrospirae bacterium]|nr:hypothetical protein [Nitrospirota bacterium]